MATHRSPEDALRRQMFMSVFPSSPSIASAPTPAATPNLAFTAPGRSFGGPSPSSTPFSSVHHPDDPIQQELMKNRAWHLVTEYLTLPKQRIESFSDTASSDTLPMWIEDPSEDVRKAIAHVMQFARTTPQIYDDPPEQDCDIFLWYIFEIDTHFQQFIFPDLMLRLQEKDSRMAIYSILQTIRVAEQIYSYPVINFLLPAVERVYSFSTDKAQRKISASKVRNAKRFFRTGLRDIVRLRFPEDHWYKVLREFLVVQTMAALELEEPENENKPENNDSKISKSPGTAEAARRNIIKVLHHMQRYGLGGAKIQQALAEAMSTLMTKYIILTCVDGWEAPSLFVQNISHWIEKDFTQCIIEAFHSLSGGEEDALGPEPSMDQGSFSVFSVVTADTVRSWKEMAYFRLGYLRVKELFDVIVDLEIAKGAIEDLKGFITTPANRALLTNSLTKTLTQRLLHPGASTLNILQFYISMIRAFSLLDPTGVLLERVAWPVRRYLKEREDTINIVVAGLLADPDDNSENENSEPSDVLVELATELDNSATYVGQGGDDDGDMDWDDMNWEPDPVDAGPDYNKSLSSDVVGSLIGLFDSTDVFVKEVQNIIGERLLKKSANLFNETRILELLKLRFNEADLQPCMVMLRDVKDSGRVDGNIRSEQKINSLFSEMDESQQPPDFHSKFLSHLFWPALRDETFVVPSEVAEMQERYETGFEVMKQSRKLTWLNALGQATVVLDLDDRIVKEDATTWQAAVIYEFQDPDVPPGTPVSRKVQELVARLRMEEIMVRNALTFWVGKRVLREDAKDVYTVLEWLDDTTMGKESAQAAVVAAAESQAVAGAPAVKSADVTTVEKMHMFWQFIQGMLTNRGAMPLQGIITMLQFAVPGGFPYSSEELREFLGHMIDEDRLEIVGGKYKIKA